MVRRIVSMTLVGAGLVSAALITGCASGPEGGGGDDDDGQDMYGTRPDAMDYTADDGAVIGEYTMIDDLEDGDGAINELLGRIGSWYSFNDGTAGGTQTPDANADFVATANGARSSAFAARTSGKGFKEWGAGIGVDLNSPGAETPTGPDIKKAWDASAFSGIAFEAKGNVAIRVSVAEIATVPKVDGGSCVPGTVDGMMCEDGHGTTIQLGSGWKTFEIKWSELKQEGWGWKAEFDPKTITGFQFACLQNLDFDFQIDNVRFFTE
jgi:hypothetical protein